MASGAVMRSPLTLAQVPASRGLLWLRRGFRAYAARPLGFSAMFAAFLFATLLSLLVPLVGGVLMVMSLPLLTLGFMIATRSALGGGPVSPAQFVLPLRQAGARRRELLKLCGLYALATVLTFVLADWLDGGSFEQLLQALSAGEAGHQEVEALMADGRLQLGLFLRGGLTALLSVPFWHAPALVHWGGQSAPQAMFSSTLALWRCRGAFVAYALGWVALVLVFGVVAALLFGLIGAPQLAGMAALPAALVFSTVFYVSLYFSFADSFALADTPVGA